MLIPFTMKWTLQGQTPFDVADESVAELLEELSQKQANVRESFFIYGTIYFSKTKMECLLLCFSLSVA